VYIRVCNGTQADGPNGTHCRARPRFDGVEVKLATDHGDEIKICQVVGYLATITYLHIYIYNTLIYTIYSYMLLGFSSVLD
jgi:hypothetical protein